MIKKEVHICLNFPDPRTEIFRDFRVFGLSPILNKENSEITEIHLKPQNTELGERNFKNSWNIVQMTSVSKWFSHLANHVPHFFLSRDSDPSSFVVVVYFSFNTQKVEIVIEKQIHMYLNFTEIRECSFRCSS